NAGLPGARPAAAQPGLGQHGQRDAAIRFGISAHGAVPLHRRVLAGTGAEPARRWIARARDTGMMLTRVPLLEMTDVSIAYRTRAGLVPAVTSVSLAVHEGEAVGLVGESGCGKSTLALASMGYFGRNGYLTGGSIRFAGQDIGSLTQQELRRIRGP